MLDRLTEEDVRALTGYVQPAAQVRWLQRTGFRHELDGRGRVLILRSWLDGSAQVPGRRTPNFAAIRRAG
jgi:hypothetical protein